jgi:uncharacterized protein
MHVGVGAFLVAASAVSVGAVMQGSVGFGANVIAAPFVAIVVPKALPATLVMVAFPLAVAVLLRERHGADRVALPWMIAGGIPGTVLGLVIIAQVSSSGLTIIVGSITLIGVAVSLVSPRVPVTPKTSLAAGFTSNVFGTASSVGGPPVALLFQHHPGPAVRPTLSGFFATSAVLSLVGYSLTGTISVDQLLFALTLIPFMLGGLWVSRHLHPLVDAGWLRPAVVALSAAAGLVAILHVVL